MEVAAQILSDITVFSKYARHIKSKERRENYKEIVTRNKKMHLDKFPDLKNEIEDAYQFVYDKKVLPSMRSFQFAGKAIKLNPARLYNCSYCPVDDPAAFSEIAFLLLAGCGVGYSVQKHHVRKLPEIRKPTQTFRYLVGDSIEGWADVIKVLMNSYFTGTPSPVFDFGDIRPKGTLLKTSGGKAPGPEPLNDGLHNIQKILDRKETGERLRPIEVHDIVCFMTDMIMTAGIRRGATISLFSLDDEEMLTCKFGNWYELNPQRARANNSAVILRHEIEDSEEEFFKLWKKIELSNAGEPGIFFTNDMEWGLNPCGEVSLRAHQFCNLVTIHAGTVDSQEDLNARAKAASFIATLQASYTDFHYLRPIWKETTEKEALIGVSMTGIASGPVLDLNLKETAKLVKEENARVAKLIGINTAARCTVIKPEGTASLVLGTSSGIHAWHSDYYIRRMRIEKDENIYTYLAINHPELLEDDFFKPATQSILSIPQKAPEGAITRTESALDTLHRVERFYKDWIKPGHRKGANKNNVSATITIKPEEWGTVGNWMWNNRNNFTALSVLPYDDHSYVQAPFEECTKDKYEEMLPHLKHINLDEVVETDDSTTHHDTAACAGGQCEIF